MAKQENARFITGEVMAVADIRGRRPGPLADVLDAEFETIGGGSARVDAVFRSGIGSAPLSGMRTLGRADPAPEPRTPALRTVAVALAGLSFWLCGGHSLLTLPIFRSAPIRIAKVTSTVDAGGVHALLRIDGEAVNDGREANRMPPLSVRVVDAGGQATLYRLGTFEGTIAPGGSFAFASRLPAPKNGVRSVSVDLDD